MASIEIQNLVQNYGPVRALKGIDLLVNEGEFFSLLGPSGCGKTTLLRLIAGFEPPSSGSIRIGGEEVTHLPPEKRRIGMVFQNYALFPHLNVFENVAYGLRAQKENKAVIAERVAEMLALVELSDYSERDIHALSGGQQQRVALARALAPHPRVLLMDEPLSNLDARLRLQTRAQILSLQRKVGMTTLYVTHDQSEALSLSDRLAVMFDGEIKQIGAPREVYASAASRQVGEFLGELNLIPCQVERGVANLLGVEIPLAAEQTGEGSIQAAIRPEAFGPPTIYPDRFEAVVEAIQFEGTVWRISIARGQEKVLMLWPSPWLDSQVQPGEKIAASFDRKSVGWMKTA
jgi:ABC-type Fe3+/spermidine/putrescine transport system ATPase subunit